MREIFETNDLAVAEEVLRERYGANLRIDGAGSEGRRILIDVAHIGPSVRLDRLAFPLDYTLTADPFTVVVLCHLSSGVSTFRSRGPERTYGAGAVFAPLLPSHSHRAHSRRVDAVTAMFDPALFTQVVDAVPGPRGRSAPIRFTSQEPLPAPAARKWAQTCTHVRELVLSIPEAERSMVAAAAAQVLAATALTVVPNDADIEPTIEDRHDAHPATLRRAVAFIDENAHTEISVADVAAHCRISIRALRLAFRRHRDTTPLAYLRQVRLAHAHDELADAGPNTSNLPAAAHRWGFPDARRFAHQYREAYGVDPSAGDTPH